MRILVAGATGAIGRQLVPRLVAAGHEVHGMTRSADKQDMLRRMDASPVLADALDPDQVANAVARVAPEVIVHQLTAIGPTSTRDMERSFAPTNQLRTAGTDHLLSAARAVGVRHFVAQGHSAIYGRTGGPLKTETDGPDLSPPTQLRQNIAALRHLEQAVLGATWTTGTVLRYGWFYGPGTTMAPGSETFTLVSKRMFPVVGNGGAVWSFIHIEDAAEATVAAIEQRKAGVFNIADDDPATVAEWLPELAKQLGARKPFRLPRFLARAIVGEAGVAMMTEMRGASNEKAKRELQWQPRYPSWRQGLVAQ